MHADSQARHQFYCQVHDYIAYVLLWTFRIFQCVTRISLMLNFLLWGLIDDKDGRQFSCLIEEVSS